MSSLSKAVRVERRENDKAARNDERGKTGL